MIAAARWRTVRARNGSVEHIAILDNDRPLATAAALWALADDGDFRRFLVGALAAAPYPAFFWEMPPVTRMIRDRPFECVAIDAPALAHAPADPTPFAGAWRAGDSMAAAFPNLPGDAVLVAPTPSGQDRRCGHLASFVRAASEERRDAFFALLGRTARKALDDEPLWISTSGLGVAWLHARLDRAPKYYQYAPWRRWP